MPRCVQCGVVSLTGRQRMYCSVNCRNDYWNAKLRPAVDRPCRRCGTTIQASEYANKAYCSQACRVMASADYNREYSRHTRRTCRNVCLSCLRQFDAKRKATRYCSSECWPKRKLRIRSTTSTIVAQAKVRTAKCRQCDNDFVAVIRKGGTQRFCSVKCRDASTYQRYNPRPEKPCLNCGKTIIAGSHANKDYCSKVCKKAVDSVKAMDEYRRRYKTDIAYRDMFQKNGHIRRARLRGATVEQFSPLSVLERDRWTCQICGIATPKELRGLKVRNAPTLDHIVPLAKGGAHSVSNTQCACHRCNASKGAKLQGAA